MVYILLSKSCILPHARLGDKQQDALESIAERNGVPLRFRRTTPLTAAKYVVFPAWSRAEQDSGEESTFLLGFKMDS